MAILHSSITRLLPSLLQLKPTRSHLSPSLFSKSFLSCETNHQQLNNQTSTKPHLLLQNCHTLDFLYKVHTLLIVNGLLEDHHLLTRETIDCYLSFDCPELALCVYHSVHRPNLLLQNLVIKCFSDHGYFADVLSLYAGFQSSGYHRSDNFTYPLVIKAGAALSCQRTGKEVHCSVLRNGYGGNLGVQTALLDMYAKSGCMGYSRKVFDEIPHRDSISWNALIYGYSVNGLDREAFEVFHMMLKTGLRPSTSTFAGLIPLGGPSIGRSLHGFAIKCGALGEESLLPVLISMYGASDDLAAARTLLETVDVKDSVSWNSMISAYSQNERPDEAFEVFRCMLHGGVRPTLVTMVSVLHSCTDLFNAVYGKVVHAVGTKLGLTNQRSVVTALVSMYGKLQELDAAEYLFHKVPERNLLLCNSMVSAYLRNGLPTAGLITFRDLVLRGPTPDVISAISAISGCSMSKDLRSGKSIHAYSLKRGFDSNTDMMNALLALYSDCNKFSATLKLLHQMQARNVISWNTLISGLARIGETESSIASFCQMQKENVKFDSVTIIGILPSLNQPEYLDLGMSFHSLVIKTGYKSDTSLKNALISMYANCGDMEAGCCLFESLSFRTIVSWNALMTGYRNHGLFKKVITLFDRMKRSSQEPNSVTLLNLLPSCETQSQGKSIHAFALRHFSELDPSFLTSTMCMYAKFENLDYCHLLFGVIDKRNVIGWNTMISVCAQNEHEARAIHYFKEMLWMGLQPDSVTMLALVSSSSRLGSLDLAQCVTGSVVRRGFGKNTAVVNALIDMNARSASLSFAREMFDGLEEKDSITWSTMINAYGLHGHGKAAVSLFEEMKESGIKPDDVTFLSVLSACSHAGLVKQGQVLFESMQYVYRIGPRAEHFACIVDLLGRTGYLGEAFNLVKRFPFRPSAGLLESLLGACRLHGDTELGEEIGKLVLKLYPSNSSSYVLLSNMYASAEKWNDSGGLRCDMDARGLRKDPGISSIQVNKSG